MNSDQIPPANDVRPLTGTQRRLEARVFEALTALTHGDVTPWVDLFAESGVQEFPYAPSDWVKRVNGKAKIAEYLKDFPKMFDLRRIGTPVWHHDGNVAIAQFEIEGTASSTGKPYDQRYISVIEHADGKITRYVDYWNPLIVQEALRPHS